MLPLNHSIALTQRFSKCGSWTAELVKHANWRTLL